MKEKKVSIIIPVYKVENYLENCLESIVGQTYKNLEIILVDDESPDSCPMICDQYAEKDPRIKVIHKKNGGAASARNRGLEIITGDYVAFVDSDDYVDENYIKRLVELLEDSRADISVCSYSNVYTNRIEKVEMEKTGIYSEEEFLERFLWDWKCGLLWNKMFKSKVIKGIRFVEGHVIDDEFFTYKVVMNANKINITNESLYYYRQRISGVMNQGRKRQILLDRIEYLTERFELVTDKYPKLRVQYLNNLADNIISFERESRVYNDIYIIIKKLQKRYCRQILSSQICYKVKGVYLYSFFIGCKNQIMQEKDKGRDDFFT